ncbi:MAG: hypothetical protein F4Z28_15345 [Gammaproteobacteria bacterium]|nr:hypothetical protein [Gammaproteobacteria bacterium]
MISRGSLGDPYDFSLRSLILGLMPGAERKGREFERTSASKKRDGVTIPGDLANALFAGRGHRMMQRTDITRPRRPGAP